MQTPTNNIRCGFTLVEMIIGMAITTITLTALTAFTFSVGTAWKANAAQADASVVANVTAVRLNALLSDARAVGAVRSGSFTTELSPAAILLWKRDISDDGVIQTTELELLAYDPAERCIMRHTPGRSVAEEPVTTAQFEDAAMIPWALASFESQRVAPRIAGMQVARAEGDNDGRAAAVETQVRIMRGNVAETFTLVTALRAGVEEAE